MIILLLLLLSACGDSDPCNGLIPNCEGLAPGTVVSAYGCDGDDYDEYSCCEVEFRCPR